MPTTISRPRPGTALISIVAAFLVPPYFAIAQEREPDPAFQPHVSAPTHAFGQGTTVMIDAGHHNFFTKDGLYKPFAAVLEADGYKVESYKGTFTTAALGNADVLVISNALNQYNIDHRTLPVLSAFTDSEIEAVVNFVASGGGLFLIVDQMPYPGAASTLAARFGIDLANASIGELNGNRLRPPPTLFKKSEGRVGDHAITRGRNNEEAIEQVASFSGTGFPVTGTAVSLIHFGQNAVLLFPNAERQFDENTARASVPGWSQGVAIEHGNGRVVIFGEAAMFTSQLSRGDNPPRGLRYPGAEENEQLLVNIVRWLSFDL